MNQFTLLFSLLFNFNQIPSCILNSHTTAVSHVDWKNITAATLCMPVRAEVLIQGFLRTQQM